MTLAPVVADLQVSEHDGIARRAFPVSGGIPLAQGVVTDAGALALQDADGRALDLQTDVLSRWADGSARWVLLDFRVDLEPTETRILRLVAGRLSEEASVSGDGVVDGEPLPRGHGDSGVRASFVRVIDAGGSEWSETVAGSTTVECGGPLRTTVCTRGAVVRPDGERRIRWEACTDFLRGKPWTRTRFTYLADAGPEPILLRELAVVADVGTGGARTYVFAGANAPWGVSMDPLRTERPGTIVQSDANDSRVIAADGSVLLEQALKSKGYVGMDDAGAGVALGLADMWQSYPKALRAGEHTLEAVLWPGDEVDHAFELAPGVARTHTLTLAPYRDAGKLDELMCSLATPVTVRLGLPDLNATGVTPALLPRSSEPAPHLEALTEMMFHGATTFTTRANIGVWGLGELHYGDFRADSYAARQVPGVYGEGDVIWGNQEAQVPYGLLLQYLRTGAVEYLLQGLACARHQADVDTIHAAADPGQIGGQHVHSVNHTAGTVTTSHMWTSGIALAYLLTGDDRLRSVLVETGEYLLRVSAGRDLEHVENRDGGWLLIALCANYEALGDERYLEEARRMTEGLRRWIERGATCLLPPTLHVFAPVHLFIALTGVADYWRLTQDTLASDTLVLGGRMALEKGRNELGYFVMEDGQSYRYPSRWQFCHCLPVMNVLYELTGDRGWIEVGMRQARLMLRMLEADTAWGQEPNWAQGGIYFAYAFPFFETARALGLLTDI